MSQTITFLLPDSLAFPPLNSALTDPNGLLAIGGDLTAERLISAYRNGIFPWYSDGEPIMWWSPTPRAIIKTADIKINRTLRKIINRGQFSLSINKAFSEVIALCADAPFRQEDTWITEEMENGYLELHQLGQAHSIEVWHEDQLVGGLYGVAINGYFSGESMFYRMPNASKLALVGLAKLLKSEGIDFVDCQLTNPFLEDMGCIEVPRATFTEMKDKAINTILNKDFWHARGL